MAISLYKKKLKKLEEDNAAAKNEEITSNLEHIGSTDNEYFVVTSCRRNQDKKKLLERELDEIVAPIGNQNVVNFKKFEKLVYPAGDVDAITVTVKDVEILESTAFLNDNIIDFYMKFLETTLGDAEKRKFYVFKCFFFTKLCNVGKKHIVNGNDRFKIAFEAVKKWTHGVSIFEKDYIFIPINERFHWSLVIVSHPRNIKNTSSEEFMSETCIVHLDSFKGYHMDGVEEHIRKYLVHTWISEHPGVTQSSAETIISKMKYIEAEVPQQENEYDCGTYVLHYSELFMRETPQVFTEQWFHASEATSKRRRIHELILSLAVLGGRLSR